MSVPHKHNSFCFISRLCDYRPALPRPPRQAPACFFLISCAITSNEACQTIAKSYTAATWVVSYELVLSLCHSNLPMPSHSQK
jgi:hypothetical protein